VYVPNAPGAGATAVRFSGPESGEEPTRSDARSEALRRMRVRTIRSFEELVSRTLEWQPEGRALIFEAPSHLPVELQRSWAPAEGAALSAEQQSRFAALSAEVQRMLGIALPERAMRGERGALLGALAPRAASATLSELVGTCGVDYVRRLVGVEPCLLAARPDALLATLDALNRRAGLEPAAAVAYVLKHPPLVGLTATELGARIDGLAHAVGLAPDEATALALERPELLMVRPARRLPRAPRSRREAPASPAKRAA
jgi:hypothetical protein